MTNELLTEEEYDIDTLKKKVQGLSLIVEILKDINSTLNLESLLGKIIKGATTILNSEIGSLMLYNKDLDCLTIKVAKGLSREVIKNTKIKVGESLSGWIFKNGQSLLISDVEKDKRFAKESSEKYYNKSFIGTPLVVKDRVIGVININNKISKDVFTQDDLWLLETFAYEAAIALENSELYEDTKRRLNELSNLTQELAASKLIISKVNLLLDKKLYDLTVINRISKAISPTPHHRNVIKSVAKVISEFIDYHIFSFLIINEEKGGEFFIDPVYLVDERYINDIKCQVMERYNNYHNRLEFKEDRIKNVFLDVTPVITHKIDKVDVVSTLSLPIKVANKVIGIISLEQFRKKAFSKEDVRLFTLVRDHLIVILENSLLYEKVEKLSITDGLTKLAVHRHFQESLIKEIRNAEKGNYPVSLFMIDIDYFKEYNDRYGHPTGDIVLQKVAQILQDNARSTDIVARYGGEEFGIILPRTDKNGAIVLGERITKAVENYKFPEEDNSRGKKITVSIGLATYPEDVLTSAALIEEADKALYQAKKNGKNQICFYKEITLEYYHQLPIKARKIALLGDFNNWSKEKYILENIRNNTWEIKFRLFPGRYRYKFLVNDTIWLSDPKALEYVDDDYGEKASLLAVK